MIILNYRKSTLYISGIYDVLFTALDRQETDADRRNGCKGAERGGDTQPPKTPCYSRGNIYVREV